MQVSQARRDLVGLRIIFCSIDFDPLYVVTTVFLLKLTSIPSDERQSQSSAVWPWPQDLPYSVRLRTYYKAERPPDHQYSILHLVDIGRHLYWEPSNGATHLQDWYHRALFVRVLIFTVIVAFGGLCVSRGHTLFTKLILVHITTGLQYSPSRIATSTHAKLFKQYVSVPNSSLVEFLLICIIVPLALWLVFGTNPVCTLLRDSVRILNTDGSGDL